MGILKKRPIPFQELSVKLIIYKDYFNLIQGLRSETPN